MLQMWDGEPSCSCLSSQGHQLQSLWQERTSCTCRSSKETHDQPRKGPQKQKRNQAKSGRPDKAHVNYSDMQQDCDDEHQSFPLYQLGNRTLHPITVNVKVNGKPLSLELDTGAAVSVISESKQKSLFPDADVRTTAIQLRTYTGEPINVVGEMSAQVTYGSQSYFFLFLLLQEMDQLYWAVTGYTT